jgi:hypothetical protein
METIGGTWVAGTARHAPPPPPNLSSSALHSRHIPRSAQPRTHPPTHPPTNNTHLSSQNVSWLQPYSPSNTASVPPGMRWMSPGSFSQASPREAPRWCSGLGQGRGGRAVPGGPTRLGSKGLQRGGGGERERRGMSERGMEKERKDGAEEEERFYSPFGGNGAYWTQNSVSHARQRIFKQLFLLGAVRFAIWERMKRFAI